MANYEYKCACGEGFERDFPMGERQAAVKCPACGKMAKRAITSPNAICRYSYFERNLGNPRVNRGKGRR